MCFFVCVKELGVLGSLVPFGYFSAKEAQLSSLMSPPPLIPPSSLPSLYKVTHLPGIDGESVILKAAIASN